MPRGKHAFFLSTALFTKRNTMTMSFAPPNMQKKRMSSSLKALHFDLNQEIPKTPGFSSCLWYFECLDAWTCSTRRKRPPGIASPRSDLPRRHRHKKPLLETTKIDLPKAVVLPQRLQGSQAYRHIGVLGWLTAGRIQPSRRIGAEFEA